MAPKLRGGEGWTFESADDPPAAPVQSLAPAAHRLKLSLEKRGSGRVVTVVSGLTLAEADLQALAKALKAACGAGGAAKGGRVEVQGDVRAKAAEWLRGKGWGLA